MIKLPVNFEDFDGNPQKIDVYFHYTKRDLLHIDRQAWLDQTKSLEERAKTIDPDNTRETDQFIRDYVTLFESVILPAYGIRSEDGTRFIKSDEIREQVVQSAWYSDWLFDMAKNPEELARIIERLVPKDWTAEAENAASPQDHKKATPVIQNVAAPTVETEAEMRARILAEIQQNKDLGQSYLK